MSQTEKLSSTKLSESSSHLDGIATSIFIPRDDEKIPLFLIKLWNIVEDDTYSDIIRWDESGYSFHIFDPYSFCRNVLPQYFKHNNLNSLIRQLNMYGFRKITSLERSGLARAESDQDHLEFSHPYFVREHPELLINIKRKPSSHRPLDSASVSIPAKDLSLVIEEIRQLREKQRTMEAKMANLVKENESIWQQMSHMRSMHVKQQQIVNKLVQFLVSLVQPSSQKRLGKRNLLAIDEVGGKRLRMSNGVQANTQPANLTEVLDRLQRELIESNSSPLLASSPQPNNHGPIIADVTDEPDTSTSPRVSPNPAPKTPQSKSHQFQTQGYNPNQLNLCLSPTLDRQLSNELIDYLNGVEQGIGNCRDLIGSHWDISDLDGLEEEPKQQLMLGGIDPIITSLSVPTTPDLLTPNASPTREHVK